jgi:DNA-binding IclR family transcriptional regulator
MGKALLAGLTTEEVFARYPDPLLPARTPKTITDRNELIRCLMQIRDQGYAVDREELEPHLCCVAAPVHGRDGAVIASVSVSGPASRLLDDTAFADLAMAVRATAGQVSSRLGAP